MGKKDKFKTNFLRLNKAVFYTGNMTSKGTDFDGGIEPWNAGIFGFWDPAHPDQMRSLHEQPLYLQDTFGIQTMEKRGDLHIQAVDKVEHNDWIRNHQVFQQFVLPWC